MDAQTLLIPTYRQSLLALHGWLDKAERELPGNDAEALLSARLADDMYPLATQVRFVCVQVHEGLARLKGEEEFPEDWNTLLEEGRGAGENSGTLSDAKARIAQTLALLDAHDSESASLADDTPVAHRIPNGMVFDLTIESYVRDWALPQLYFHLMVAYAILRSAGVALGKADFVAHMFGYLRPGTMPGA